MAPHRKTSCSTHIRLKQASLLRKMGNLKNVQYLKFMCSLLTSHTICFYLSHTRAYTLVHCKISSISCLLFFSLWVLYLTITCNDRDITIMITPLVMLHLAHMHTLKQTDTHELYTSWFCSVFVKLESIQIPMLQPTASQSSQHVCVSVQVCGGGEMDINAVYPPLKIWNSLKERAGPLLEDEQCDTQIIAAHPPVLFFFF